MSMKEPNITAILIDDEPMALASIERMLTKYCPNVQIIGKTINPKEAINLIDEKKPDLLFLDISMPNMDGFTLLKQLKCQKSNIVFITAYDEYALKAFKVTAVDYLLKPISKDELISAVTKVSKRINSSNKNIQNLFEYLQQNKNNIDSIALPTMEGLHFVKFGDIVYCKSDGNYTEIFLTSDEKIVISRQIKFLEEKLDGTQFIRVHQSYIVNLNFIKKYLKGRGGILVMTNGDNIPVSVRKKNDFLDSF